MKTAEDDCGFGAGCCYQASQIEQLEAEITRLKLSQQPAQQEPVVWEQFYPEMGKPKLAYLPPTESTENACYTTPQPAQREWVGLTDAEVEDFVSALWPVGAGAGKLLRAIEAAHGIKE